MYDTFFEHIKPKEINSLAELETQLHDRPDYRTVFVDPTSIRLTDDGNITYNGNQGKMSLEGFRNMVVQLYKIPDPFAKRIPLDALQYNIERLGKEINFPIQFVFREDGLIINAVKDELKAIDSAPLIHLFHDHEVKKVLYSDYGVQVQTINPSFGEKFEPKVGDITGVGVNFNNSETGFWNPQAEILVWQLACSNGAIMSKRFGQVKVRIKRAGLNAESIARSFEFKLQKLLDDSGIISSRMQSMVNSNLTNENIATVIKAASRLVGVDQVEESLEIERERIKDIKALARIEEHKDEETEFNAHEIYSKITNLANDYHDPIRRKLQVLGGKMFEFEYLGGKVNLN